MEPTAVDVSKMERRSSAAVKRRVSRACDHCHRMRTRCNGNWFASPRQTITDCATLCRTGAMLQMHRYALCGSPSTYSPADNTKSSNMFANIIERRSVEERFGFLLTAVDLAVLTDSGTKTHSETKGGRGSCLSQPTDTKRPCAKRSLRESWCRE